LSVRALAEGKIAPTSLKVIRPRIRLIRDESGAFELDMGGLAAQAGSQPDTQPDTGTGSNADVLALLLNELSGPAQTGSSLLYLNRVSVIGAVLRLEDRQLGINWGARHADITVERALVGLRATFDLDIDLQTSRPELHGEATFERSAERIDVKFDFARVNASQLGDQFAALAGLKTLMAEFSGNGNLRIGLDGDIQRAEFTLNSGQGSFIAPGVNAPPYAFKSLTIDGRLNRDPDQIQIAGATVDFGSTKATLAGVVTRVGAIAAVNATVSIPSMPADDLKKFWPPDAASGARDWMTANMRDGVYRDTTASLTARIQIDGKNAGNVTVDSINGHMNISGVTIDYLNPMPPLKNVVATGTFSDGRFDFAAQGGNVGDLVLDGGTVAISGIRSGTDTLALTALIRGPVRSALDIVAHPRLNLLSKAGLKTEGAAGAHTTRLELKRYDGQRYGAVCRNESRL
ncbi:MAG: YhdP family protein, partial [Alphaproteobacteria bacterium]